jgi:hypothetical protein
MSPLIAQSTSLLRLRSFRVFFFAHLLFVFADTSVYLVFAVWAKTLVDAVWAPAGVFVAFVAPSLLGPFAGAAIDRLPKTLVLKVTTATLIVSVLSLLSARGQSGVWLIYLVAFIYGGAYVVFQGARSSLVITLVARESLGSANAALRTSREVAKLVGPLAAVGLFAYAGSAAFVLVVATALAGSLTLLFAVREQHLDVSAVTHEQPQTITRWHDLTAGVRHLAATNALRTLLILICVTLLVAGFYDLALFTVVRDIGRPLAFLGVLTTAQGAGAVAGGLISARVMALIGDLRLVGYGLILEGLGIIVTAQENTLAVVVGSVLFGFGSTWPLVGMDTALQLRTPAMMQARVVTAVEAVTSVPFCLSFAFAAVVLSAVPAGKLLIVMSLVTAASGGWLAVATPRLRSHGRSNRTRSR